MQRVLRRAPRLRIRRRGVEAILQDVEIETAEFLGTERLQPVRDLDQIRSFLSGLGPTAFFDVPWIPIYIVFISLVAMAAGILNTWSRFAVPAVTPALHYGVESRVAWLHLADGLPEYESRPGGLSGSGPQRITSRQCPVPARAEESR